VLLFADQFAVSTFDTADWSAVCNVKRIILNNEIDEEKEQNTIRYIICTEKLTGKLPV